MRSIEHALLRFPDQGEAIRRLYLCDEAFRSICEDIELAVNSLRCFEARPDAGLRSEIDDYRHMLAELEAELREYLILPRRMP